MSEGTLDAARMPEILKRAAADRAYWTLVEVASEVLAAAEILAAAHPFRALDAVHIASAQMFASRLTDSALLFVSADGRQTAAATASGMAVKHIGS